MIGGRIENEEEPTVSAEIDSDPMIRSCGKGHRSSLLLPTPTGGAICLVCFSNLVSDPSSPSHHVSYALSQISQGVNGEEFRRILLTFHAHLLVTPLVQAMCSFEDEAIGRQAIDLVSDLCCSGGEGGGCGLVRDFITRIGDRITSGVLGWSRRQIYMLHCLGILLDHSYQTGELSTGIKNTTALVSNLIIGLHLPSEEIHGEILFVLYKLSLLQDMPWDYDDYTADDDFLDKLPRISLETLLKAQRDEVRLNCIAFLTVLVRKGLFEKSFTSTDTEGVLGDEDNLMQSEFAPTMPLVNLFADAMKGPLLSTDAQVQIGMLNLIFYFLLLDAGTQLCHVFVKEGVADYVFEILRLSENIDPLIISCLRVLDLLATAEEFFRQRLVSGLPVLLSVLKFIAEIPLHPVQPHALRLVKKCISDCPGVISISQLEDLAQVLTEILRRHTSGELGMLPDTFILVCLTFVEVTKTPSSEQLQKLSFMLHEASRNAILSSLSASESTSELLLHSLYLLKQAYCYVHIDGLDMETHYTELASGILEICEAHLLPWLRNIMNEGEDEYVVLGVLETFHFILIQGNEIYSRKFAKVLVSSSWFNLSFGFLGLFPSERMKWRMYMVFSSIIDGVLGQDFGQPIRDSCVCLPSDPLDLIFLLGQKTTFDVTLFPAQSAVILILYTSSLYDERLADDSQVLASLEQYILLNNTNFTTGIVGSTILTQLLHLYCFVRGSLAAFGIISYSSEAEKIMFQLVTENNWDLLYMGVHPTALKWMFEQDRLITPLSYQIRNFCRYYKIPGIQLNSHTDQIHVFHIQSIADLVLSGDNCATSLLISLLKHTQQESQEDVIFVIDVIQAILDIFPEASNGLCLHCVDGAIFSLYDLDYEEKIFSSCSALLFNILQSVRSETLCHGGSWFLLTVKLLECLVPKFADEGFSEEACLIIGILSLILNHSTHHALIDASKAILFNSSLISAVYTIVQSSCAKGPALAGHNEETTRGEPLMFVLLLYFFSLKSLNALLQENLDWEDFLQSPDGNQPFSIICIHCHDLCKLIHFGPSSIKLVASQCLLELLTRISSYHKDKMRDELRCSMRHLQSIIAVVEGLVFYEDSTIATNCGLCLSIVLGWGKKMKTVEKRSIKISKWSKLVIEELALSLAISGLTSTSFTIQHKPATHIAIALLQLDDTPSWMKSVFNTSCISGIINKLSARNMSAEMVELFRELYARDYMNKEHVESLQSVFQACRKHIYSKRAKVNYCSEENVDRIIVSLDGAGDNMCKKVLVPLMLSTNKFCSGGSHTKQNRLLEEIETIVQLLRDTDQ